MGKEKQREIEIISKQIIKYKGLFNFNKMMKAAPEWFNTHKWMVLKKEKEQEVQSQQELLLIKLKEVVPLD